MQFSKLSIKQTTKCARTQYDRIAVISIQDQIKLQINNKYSDYVLMPLRTLVLQRFT